MTSFLTKTFWTDLGERAVRTFAQVLVAHATVAEGFEFTVAGLKVAGAATLASALMSLAAKRVGTEGDASVL